MNLGWPVALLILSLDLFWALLQDSCSASNLKNSNQPSRPLCHNVDRSQLEW